MLILTRYIGEDIIIKNDDDEEIIIRVMESPYSRQFKIGIEAPRKFIIHRKEIWDIIEKEGSRKVIKMEPNKNGNC